MLWSIKYKIRPCKDKDKWLWLRSVYKFSDINIGIKFLSYVPWELYDKLCFGIVKPDSRIYNHMFAADVDLAMVLRDKDVNS